MNRRHTALAILVAWIGAVGWLLARRLSEPPGTAGLLAVRRLGPGAAYYDFELAGRPVGSAGLTIDTLTSGFSMLIVLGLDGLGTSEANTRLAIRSEIRMGRTFRLLTARTNLTEADSRRTVEVVVDSDSLATVRVGARGDRARIVGTVSVSGATIPSSFGFKLAAAGRLQTGTSFETPLFDPVSGDSRTLTAVIVRDTTWVLTDSATVDTSDGVWSAVPTDTVRAWELEVRSPTPFRLWITDQGWPIRWEYPLGARLTRRAFELVETDYRRQRRDGLLPRMETAPGLVSVSDLGLVPDPRVDRIDLLISRRDGPAAQGAAALFEGGRQTVHGDTVSIGLGDRDPEPAPPMRYRNTEGFSARASAILWGALREAQERYGNDADTVASLVKWVARDVRLQAGVSAAVAPDIVAETAGGSPEGKVRLFVALARRAGYAARAVTGVLVVHPLLPRHTWAEVWVDGWRAVDPTFGHLPASASLLRVMEGPGRIVPLLTVVGALRTTPIATAKERQR